MNNPTEQRVIREGLDLMTIIGQQTVQLKVLTTDLERCAQMNQAANQELKKREDKISALEKQVLSLEQQLGEQEAEVARLATENEELHSQRKMAEQQVKETPNCSCGSVPEEDCEIHGRDTGTPYIPDPETAL